MRSVGLSSPSFDDETRLLDAGLKGVISVAAVVTAVAAVVGFVQEDLAPTWATSASDPYAQPRPNDVLEAAPVVFQVNLPADAPRAAPLSAQFVDAGAYATRAGKGFGARHADTAHAAEIVPTVETIAPELAAVQFGGIGTPEAIHNVSFDERALALRLHPMSETPSNNEPFTLSQPHHHAKGGALRAAAQRMVSSWRAPTGSETEVGFFVASDDESIRWSMNHNSPNRGSLAYQDNHVDSGDLSVGLSMSKQDLEVAVAYVEQDEPSRTFGINGVDEHYAGLVLTLHN